MRVLEDDRFRSGDIDTHLLESMDLTDTGHHAAAAIAATIHRWHLARRRSLATGADSRAAWGARGRRSALARSREGER